MQKKGPTYTMGDFNARVQTIMNEDEKRYLGKHTFDKEKYMK